MQYLMLLHLDPDAPEQTGDDVIEGFEEYTATLHEAGALVSGEALQPPHTATTLRVRDSRRLLTDGPYLETKDLLIGYYVIDVADLDVAIDWAARLPLPGQLAVEILPVAPSSASGAARLARG